MGGLHSDFSLNSNIRIFGLLCLQLICTQVLTIIITILNQLNKTTHTHRQRGGLNVGWDVERLMINSLESLYT